MAEDTIFGKILRGEIPCSKVYEDDRYFAFHDINPAAPTHVLVIPKKPLPKVSDAEEADEALLGGLVLCANKIARQLGIAEGGYRLVVNCGKAANQEVFHLHLHLLGGRDFTWPPG